MKKFALLGAILLVIGVLGTIFNWNHLLGETNIKRIDDSVTVEASDLELIEMNIDVANLNLYQIDGDSIQIDYRGRSHRNVKDILTVNNDNDTLYVEVTHRSRWFNLSFIPFWNKHTPKIDIGIPAGFDGIIDTNVDVGKINVENLNLKQFNAVVNVGNIEGKRVFVEEGTIEVDVGEINLTDVSSHWDLETNIGDINLELQEWEGRIDARSNIGELTFRLPSHVEYYSLHLEAELGKVRGIDHPIIGYRSATETGPSLNAFTDIGDIEIHWQR